MRILFIIISILLIKNSYCMNIEDVKIITESIPAQLTVNKNGEIEGFLGERVNKLRKKLNIKSPIEVLPWARAYNEVLKNEGTMIIGIGVIPEKWTIKFHNSFHILKVQDNQVQSVHEFDYKIPLCIL